MRAAMLSQPWCTFTRHYSLHPQLALFSWLVIPAKAGIQFFLLRVKARASTVLRPARSLLGKPRLPLTFGQRVTFLTPGILPCAPSGPAPLFAPLLRRSACTKKSNQEKHTPTAAPSGHPALQVRSRTPGFADSTSVC